MAARRGRGISEVSDVLPSGSLQTVAVEIEILLEEREPPVGSVVVADHDPVPFVGWLGLIRALSELFDDHG